MVDRGVKEKDMNKLYQKKNKKTRYFTSAT